MAAMQIREPIQAVTAFASIQSMLAKIMLRRNIKL
jgi:hypothetical protein